MKAEQMVCFYSNATGFGLTKEVVQYGMTLITVI